MERKRAEVRPGGCDERPARGTAGRRPGELADPPWGERAGRSAGIPEGRCGRGVPSLRRTDSMASRWWSDRGVAPFVLARFRRWCSSPSPGSRRPFSAGRRQRRLLPAAFPGRRARRRPIPVPRRRRRSSAPPTTGGSRESGRSDSHPRHFVTFLRQSLSGPPTV